VSVIGGGPARAADEQPSTTGGGAKNVVDAGASGGARDAADAGGSGGAREIAEPSAPGAAEAVVDAGASGEAKNVVDAGGSGGARDVADAGGSGGARDVVDTSATGGAQAAVDASASGGAQNVAAAGAPGGTAAVPGRSPTGPGPLSAGPPLIETGELTKRYPKGVTALDQLTLAIEPGIVGLVGANGAGKSTLIKILLGLVPPTDGTAQVLGMDCQAHGERVRARVGYMPEHDCLPPDVSAAEFVTHMGRMSGIPAAAARERAADVLRHVGLHEERYRLIGGYSTGMKQRVKLAQSLVHDPALLLLDEPTNGLDPAGREAMLVLIRRIGTEFGISVLVASHLLGEIEQICDSLVAIDSGRLLRHASIASFTEHSQVLAVEVEEGADALATRLAEHGHDVTFDDRALLLHLSGEDLYDLVRDLVVDLGLRLNRLEQRRHRVEELFADPPQNGEAEIAGAHRPEVSDG
jgi:ABC-2 type transport system ATP-binding protein